MYALYNKFYKQIEIVISNDRDAELLLSQRKDIYLAKRITDKDEQKRIAKEAENLFKLDTYEEYGGLIMLYDDYEGISMSIDQLVMDVSQNFVVFIRDVLPNIIFEGNEKELVDNALAILYDKYRICSDPSEEEQYNDGLEDNYDIMDRVFNRYMLYNEYYKRNIK